jgi:hypothetical protein
MIKAFVREIQANHFVNGKKAGTTEYRFVDQYDKGAVLSVDTNGRVKMFGAASNEEWPELIEAMIEDRG